MVVRRLQQYRTKTAEHDTKLQVFYDSIFMAIEPCPAHPATLTVGTLTNNIAPLFARGQWEVHGEMSNEDWAEIDNSCRLASRLLHSEALVRFWNVLLNRAVAPVPAATETRTGVFEGLYRFRPHHVHQNRRIRRRDQRRDFNQLMELDTRIKFKLEESYASGAVCVPATPTFPDPTNPDSRNSIIGISRKDLMKLRAARLAGDTPRQLWHSFELAVMMVHETAHAVWNLTNGVNPIEPFYGNGILSELGYELERALFGGVIQRLYWEFDNIKLHKMRATKQSSLTGAIVLWRFPWEGVATQYEHQGYNMGVRKKPVTVNTLDLAWRVDVAWLQRFFDDNAWQTMNTPKGLYPPKEVGYNFRVQLNPSRDAIAQVVPVQTSAQDRKYFSRSAHQRLAADGSIVKISIAGGARVTGRTGRIAKVQRTANKGKKL